MNNNLGCGNELFKQSSHPYINKESITTEEQNSEALDYLNKGRDHCRDEAVEVTYYFELFTTDPPMKALVQATKMVLEHGTLKPWQYEGDVTLAKPPFYDKYMAWATDIHLLGYNAEQGLESGLVTLAFPLIFFDKAAEDQFPLAQMLMAIASEPMTAFSFYQGAKLVDISLPDSLRKRCPGPKWPHHRIRSYLSLSEDEPIIGTIVKPKTGLTPALFSRCVVEAATAGARFTKADENFHLSLSEIPKYVGQVVKDLEAAGFDLSRPSPPTGTAFLFAPHITTDFNQIRDYAKAALDAGANALMFSPYYSGGFIKMAEIIEEFDVPVYAHTAGMNVFSGASTWGLDSRINYVLSGLFGAAFMQLTTLKGYLKPTDVEKPEILRSLAKNHLEGSNGMTLAIAGGLGPHNLGTNIRYLGKTGRMLLAGTSVYSHPDGPSAGVKALILAYQAVNEYEITEIESLKSFARSQGAKGKCLTRALENF